MKVLIASVFASLMAAATLAAPALAEPVVKTQLVSLDGAQVDKLPLRFDFNAVWVVDTQNLLWRDDARDHYLVTLTEACRQLAVRRPFSFQPSERRLLQSSRTYEVHPLAGQECKVAKIEQVGLDRATALRAAALRRAW